jgi:hypothetical protein
MNGGGVVTGDRLGNLLDHERPREVLDDRGPHRLGRSRSSRPLPPVDGHRRARPSCQRPEVRRTDIGVSTDPMRSILGALVQWSQTPQPRQVRELLFVVLAGSPGAAALGLARAWQYQPRSRQPRGSRGR